MIATVSRVSQKIIEHLAYFDVFDFPLTQKELFNLIGDAEEKEILESLNELEKEGRIARKGNHYSTQKELNTTIQERTEQEANVKRRIKFIRFFSWIISQFPFVRGVAISGSVSKGVMGPKGDVDFFVISKPNYLWTCRVLLMGFKKIFLLNSRKYFCANYFISQDALEISDKNRFTATEIVFLIPMYNPKLFDRFFQENRWTEEYYPSFKHPYLIDPFSQSTFFLKHLSEWIFSSEAFSNFESWAFKVTTKRWQKKFDHFDEETFDLTMRSNKKVSKHHPLNFQEKVLSKFESNLSEIES